MTLLQLIIYRVMFVGVLGSYSGQRSKRLVGCISRNE